MSAKKRKKKSARDKPELLTKQEEPEETSPPEPEHAGDPGAELQEEAKEEEKPEEDNSPSMPHARVVRCPVCGGTGQDHAKEENITVCRCEDCGLLFQNPRPSLRYIAGRRNLLFEDAIAKPHGDEIREQTGIAQEIMKGYHHRMSGRPAVLNAFGKHVLEVHCGLGLRLREFQKYGWTVYGIDPSRDAVEYGKACSLQVEHAWLEDAAFKTGTFNLVVFHDAFSEISDPVHAVRLLLEVLRDDGLVYVHIPAGEEGSFKETELFYYDPDSLRRVFMQNGFTVKLENNDLTGYFFWFGKKNKGLEHASDES